MSLKDLLEKIKWEGADDELRKFVLDTLVGNGIKVRGATCLRNAQSFPWICQEISHLKDLDEVDVTWPRGCVISCAPISMVLSVCERLPAPMRATAFS